MRVEVLDDFEQEGTDLESRKKGWESSTVPMKPSRFSVDNKGALASSSSTKKGIAVEKCAGINIHLDIEVDNTGQVNSNCNTEEQGQGGDQSAERSPNANNPEQEGKDSKMRRLTIQRKTKLIERRKTILSVLITNKKVFAFILSVYKHKITTLVFAVLWLILYFMFLSICFEFPVLRGEIYLPLQLLFTFNFCIHHFIFIRVEMVKELAKSFNFWYTIFNALSFHVCFFLIWGWNLSVVSMSTHSVTSTILLILFDAHASKERPIMKKSAVIAIACYIPVFILLIFRLVKFDNETITDNHTGIEIMNVRLQAIDNLSTLFVYLIRIIYNHLRMKNSTTIAFLSEFYELTDPKNKKGTPQVDIDYESKILQHKEKTLEIVQKEMKSVIPSGVGMSESKKGHSTQRDGINCSNQPCVGAPDPEPLIGDDQINPETHLVMGILDCNTIEYNSQHTIYHQHIHKKSKILEAVIKSKFYVLVGTVVCSTSAIISLPICSGMILNKYFLVSASIMTTVGLVYIFFQIFITTNLFIFGQILRSFDYWYVMPLLFKFILSSGILCKWDIRMLFWFFMALSVKWFIMIDSFSVNSRKKSYISVIGIIWMVAITIVCKIGLGDTFTNDKVVGLKSVQFLSPKITLSTSAFSLALFIYRFVWSYHKNPNRFLFITENVKVVDVSR